MKIIRYKKHLIATLHLLFWLISINLWYIVFNPGVESSGAIRGMDDFWLYILLFNILFYIYILLPLVLLLRNTRKWIKITALVIFIIPVVWLIYLWINPVTGKDEISFFRDSFVYGFMYVVVFHLPVVAAVYINLKIVVPRFLNQSRFGIYIASVLCLILLASVLNFTLFDHCIDLIVPSVYFISYYRIWELILITGAYLLFTTLLYLIWQYASLLIANREKAQNELSALKGQINPHFLFNNLNTIYSLTTKNDEHAKDVILQLSDFLRYMLYDTASDSIPLEKEIEIIRTYTGLQKERLDPEITPVLLSIEGDFKNAEIAPLLMLPLVENCFKHGVGKEPGQILISIGYNDKQLRFSTENNVALREITGQEVNGGIGIKNVEKRLNLLYPDRYSLRYGQTDKVFRVDMSINLRK